MNKSKRKLIINVVLLMALILFGTLYARAPFDKANQMARPDAASAFSMINVGNWTYWAWDDGAMGNIGNLSGGFYPTLTAAIVYKDGFIWAGFLGDEEQLDPETNMIIAGNMYYDGLTKGWIDATGTPVNPNNEEVGVYMTRQDWADLTFENVVSDAAEWHQVDVADVTEEQALEYIQVLKDGWREWPVEFGAPYYDEDGNGVYNPELDVNGMPQIGVWDANLQTYTTYYDRPGLANADQVVWLALNDMNSAVTTPFFGKAGIGMELQITLWAYNQPTTEVGSVVFKKFRLINKSNLVGVTDSIYHMYVGQFVDPDVGASANDYVGCDSVLGLAIGYNADLTDTDFDAFNLPPAAVGYDFFAGPLVYTGDPADTAIFDLKKVPGYINLKMTSFAYFSAGSTYSDPNDGDSDFEQGKRMYNLMRGYAPTPNLDSPESYTHNSGPYAGRDTHYPLNGDVFRQTGDLDGRGDFTPGDRRMFLGSGPFTMAPGDTQEVVLAVVGGIVNQAGGNNMNAVEQMKFNDIMAQFLFDNLFAGIPRPPKAPNVKYSVTENSINLDWGWDLADVIKVESNDPVLGFNFQGYNIWQFPDQTPSLTAATRVATFDLADQIMKIWGQRFVPSYGDILAVPIQVGTDTGIQRSFVIDFDYINQRALFPGNTYYFAVTAYNYVDNPLIPNPSLESEVKVIAITPQSEKPGEIFNAGAGDVVTVSYDGPNDGQVFVTVVSPELLTGDAYQVYFTMDDDSTSDTYEQMVWNLKNTTTNTDMLTKQVIRNDVSDNDQKIVDGMIIKVAGPALDYKDFQVVANASGVLATPQGAAADWQGFPGIGSSVIDDQQTNGSIWLINSTDNADASYARFLARSTGYTGGANGDVTGILFLIPRDYEVRFTETGSPSYFNWTTGEVVQVPFELWCVGNVADPADDYQCYPWVLDNDEDGAFSLNDIDHATSGGTNDPYTDGIYWVEPISRTQAGYEALAQATADDPDAAGSEVLWAYLTDYDPWNSVAGMMRMVFVNWNGGDVAGGVYNAEMPETGTVFRIMTTKPIELTDVYTFTAPEYVAYNAGKAKSDVSKINVYPNPYYAFNARSTTAIGQFVTFSHLPEKATIRIFNLAGELVRTIEHDDATSPLRQFHNWDLLNDSSLPVASGLYIAYIDMPDLGKSKVLKFYIIQKEQILTYY